MRTFELCGVVLVLRSERLKRIEAFVDHVESTKQVRSVAENVGFTFDQSVLHEDHAQVMRYHKLVSPLMADNDPGCDVVQIEGWSQVACRPQAWG